MENNNSYYSMFDKHIKSSEPIDLAGPPKLPSLSELIWKDLQAKVETLISEALAKEHKSTTREIIDFFKMHPYKFSLFILLIALAASLVIGVSSYLSGKLLPNLSALQENSESRPRPQNPKGKPL